MLAAVGDGSGGGYLEGCPAQGRSVRADHEADLDRGWLAVRAGLRVDVEDVDPVGGVRGLVIE